MGTISDKLNKLLNTKAAIKAAIIAKGQSVADSDTFASYPAKIQAIETGVQLPTLTTPGTAADLLTGKQLIDADGNILTGTMPEVPQATLSISVSSSGLITASATQSAGKVAAGNKSATSQLLTQAAKTITPGTNAKMAVSSGRYTTGPVTVAGDANLIPENIKSGVSIFDVDGTLADGIKLYEDDSLTATILSEYNSVLSSTFYSLKINLPITVSEIVGFIIYGQDSSGLNCVICGLIREDYSNKYTMIYGVQNSIVNAGTYSFDSNSLTTGQIWNSATTGSISSFTITHCTIFYR